MMAMMLRIGRMEVVRWELIDELWVLLDFGGRHQHQHQHHHRDGSAAYRVSVRW